ncbi:MAG: YqhA family protein [Caldimicrobium sp.]|nr:YqhA family protein [Caldimicrobium sp.]MCX7874190.1 YqhA family protein [Caldimicrobium sp.]MDW8093806.1 YqhA family protein [Caldimicrobium sp.]
MKISFKYLAEISRKVVYIPIITLFIGALFLSLYGSYQMIEIFLLFFKSVHYRESIILSTKLITIMDNFLLAVILYIFALGLYELFIGPLNVPPWLKIEGIDQLKAKLASVIILLLAITFTKRVVQWDRALDTLFFGISIGLVMGVLILYYKIKEH